jgi:ketosteroid isomerase-like protein
MATISQTNEQVVLKFIEAMGSNDPETAASTLAPDAVAVTKGYGKFAGARKAELVIGAIESFKTIFPTGLRFTIHSVTAAGDRVVVEAQGDAITGDGEAYRNQYCFVATLENGKIKQFNEYLCSAYADAVLWPMVERLGALKLEED